MVSVRLLKDIFTTDHMPLNLLYLVFLVYFIFFSPADVNAQGGLAALTSLMGRSGGAGGLGAASAMGSTGMGAAAGGGGGGGGGGGMSALGRRFSSILNNPLFLCRETENMRPIPCSRTPQMCDLHSMRAYGMPGLMQCSPVGFGCCLKDFMSLQMARWAN